MSNSEAVLGLIRERLLDPEVLWQIDDELFLNGVEIATVHTGADIAALAAGVLISAITGECHICAAGEARRRLREEAGQAGTGTE